MNRWIPLVLMVFILGVPFVMRRTTTAGPPGQDLPRLIVITPHVTQIRAEFARGFDAWHRRTHGTGVRVDFRTPGGTSEIIKQLSAQYTAAFRRGDVTVEWQGDKPTLTVRPGSMDVDVMFGGGSYDHGRLKTEIKVPLIPPGEREPRPFPLSMSEPAGFTQARLDEWYGPNSIGAEKLYDPEQCWLGTALSSFGIVYNRDVLRDLGLAEPTVFTDLGDPRLAGWVALADPRQSGSITTTLDAILSGLGWERGWRLLREMSANARYFTNVSTKPPIDVGQGECAVGLAIDFYGRGQAQSIEGIVSRPGAGRVGYIDPAGSVYVDADPVSILAGGPNPELARRFVEFLLSEEGQAIWQFPSRADPRSADNPPGPSGEPMGPVEYELRRMPARRIMYERYASHFIDQVNPFELASKAKPAGWRRGIPIMMGAFGIDTGHELREAWIALNAARGEPTFPRATLDEMERLFYAFPETDGPDGQPIPYTPETFKAVEAVWKKDPMLQTRAEIAYRAFYRQNYARVVELSRSAAIADRPAGR